MYELISQLYPFCRSITGDGVRQTLRALQGYIDVEIHEVPTGTPVFDWTVPREWNIRDAYVKNAEGERVIDFRQSNLHVVGYSVPVHARMTLEELGRNLHTLPEQPDWIPYRTSYYAERWGFCLAHNDLLGLSEGEYEVCVDSSLDRGHLSYGELYLKGDSEEEILLHTHICHPSMCNDNLSGIALTTYLNKIAPPEDIKPTLAMGVSMNHIASVVAPLIGGIVWKTLDYSVVFLGGAAVAAVSLIAAQWIKPEQVIVRKIQPEIS
jgi:aminopeptidase-like protein